MGEGPSLTLSTDLRGLFIFDASSSILLLSGCYLHRTGLLTFACFPCSTDDNHPSWTAEYIWPELVAAVVPKYLTEGVQYFLYDQLLLILKVFCRITVFRTGSSALVHSGVCTVSVSREIPPDELAFN